MNIVLILLLVFINIPLYKIVFNMFFASKEEFNESIRYSFIPDIVSLFRREYIKDIGSQFKLQVYIFICIAAIGIEFVILKALLHGVGLM